MNAAAVAAWLSWCLDMLALGTLLGTFEVGAGACAVLALAATLRGWKNYRLSSSLSATGVLLITLCALIGWLQFSVPPVIAAAQAAPLLHALVWFMPEGSRSRGLRLGLGFVELILASALTSEPYLFASIFAFVVVGAVAASCNFLATELRVRAPERFHERLPRDFVARCLGLAGLIFLSSLLIFPMLPRPHWDSRLLGDTSQIGYTEEVNITDRVRFAEGEGGGSAVLRLYSPGGLDLAPEIYLGLIRGKALSDFDGFHWSASQRVRTPAPRSELKPERARHRPPLEIEAVREAIGSGTLPVPYGTVAVRLESDGSSAMRSARGGEWLDRGSMNERVPYKFEFVPYEMNPFADAASPESSDAPQPANLAVPPVLRTERMNRLARALFTGVVSEREKVNRVTGYFQKEGFHATESSGSDELSGFSPRQKLHPLERFLFIDREGHCELFASSTAVLLRLAGVPTRLVAGFRLSRGTIGGILTVRSSDAHAWLEIWETGKGWRPVDPTPRLSMPWSWTSSFRDSYEWASGYWYRYILTFSRGDGGGRGESADQAPPINLKTVGPRLISWARESASWIATALLGLGFLGGASYLFLLWRFPRLFSIAYRVREGSGGLRRERIRMDRLLSRSGVAEPDAIPEIRAWRELYLKLRFGRKAAEPAGIEELARRRQAARARLS